MKKSAGILLFRRINHSVEFLLVHPGGPYFKNKDAGAWTIPKGEFDDNEDALVAAKREFKEETGQEISGNYIELTPVKQKAGKMVFAWALEGDIVAENITSNTFEIDGRQGQAKCKLSLKWIKQNGFLLVMPNKKSIHRRQP